MIDSADIVAVIAAEASSLGSEIDANAEDNAQNILDLIEIVLSAYRKIRQERDNLADTVELCCLPVAGEVSLCDRVQAAGEAQRELKRLREGDTWNGGPR